VYTQHEACNHWYECGDFAATVSVLLRYGATKTAETDVGHPSSADWQPIHYVAGNAGHAGSAAAIKLLITDHKFAVDALIQDTARTPAWVVARHASADSNSSSSSSDSSSTDTTQYTLECLQQLLELGASVYATGEDSLLYAAAASGSTRVAQFLFEQGLQLPAAIAAADLDGDTIGTTPLHIAAEKGHVAMVKFLLSKGARVDDRDAYGFIPLRSCLRAPPDGAELFKVLVAAGSDPLDVTPAAMW
jgi:Ankyrin repeats (3 copies)